MAIEYVKNNDGDTTGNWQYTFKPYRMSEGDTVELIAYVSPQDADLKFESKAMGTHTLTDLVTVVNHEDELLPDGRISCRVLIVAFNDVPSMKWIYSLAYTALFVNYIMFFSVSLHPHTTKSKICHFMPVSVTLYDLYQPSSVKSFFLFSSPPA